MGGRFVKCDDCCEGGKGKVGLEEAWDHILESGERGGCCVQDFFWGGKDGNIRREAVKRGGGRNRR